MAEDSWQAKIQAYVDAELPAEEMRGMDAHLRDCPGCAAAVVQHMQLKRAIQLAGKRYAPRPEFRRRVLDEVAPKAPSRRWLWLPSLAVAALLVLIAFLAVTRWSERVRSQQLLGELADLHVTNLASSTPVEVVSSDRHTVKPWFQGKLPFTFDLPELAGTPFTLAGGRMAYLRHQPGAHLIYNLRSHHISVFIFQDRPGWAPALPASASSATVLSFHVESWRASGLRYFVVGDAGRDEMRELSQLLQQAGRS